MYKKISYFVLLSFFSSFISCSSSVDCLTAEECFKTGTYYFVYEHKFNLAEKYLTKAIIKKPNYAEAYLQRANVRYLTMDLENACIDRNRARQYGWENENDIVAAYCRGELQINK